MGRRGNEVMNDRDLIMKAYMTGWMNRVNAQDEQLRSYCNG